MPSLILTALEGLPEVVEGDDLPALVREALARTGIALADGDVLVVAQKVVSKQEGRRVALSGVEPSARAIELAAVTRKDARLVELVLRESAEVLRAKPDVIVVEHRRGWIMANAGIDLSNVDAGGGHALLLPEDPDASCASLRAALADLADIGVIVNDSFGRAWRNGVTGTALGVAGLPGVVDLRGRRDRFGRELRTTEVAVADELAAAASLLMGQADEGRPVIHARGVPYARRDGSGRELLRPKSMDMFR
ncbi:MAG: coenzyme F420-0:L-glutamate ligase [Burkholderiales bacterium]|jgi:coenzyme F420-0:L-glutamate ligase / coenzyme F420-1:gamma-L-glutamate ligase|nr:coenzyme F420-0:L-glutamate ligase [Burkholderiales bacterium]